MHHGSITGIHSFVEILPPLKDYFRCIDEPNKSDLIWTKDLNGMYLDYYAMPKIGSYLSSNIIAVDLENNTAAIPGDGNVSVTFTYTFDAARFLVAALDLDQWPKQMRIHGDTVT